MSEGKNNTNKKYLFLYTIYISAFILLFSSFSAAQSMRELINDGVDLYKDKKFTDSEVNFKKGLEKSPDNFAANFNLGDAYYKQQRYDDALNSFQSALAQTQSNNEKAKVYHNIGNSLLKSDKIKESVEAYKKSLKLNPDDADTKYNLSYALNLLNQQKNQQQQDKNDKNKQDDKDNKNQQNQDQNKDQDKDKQEQDKNQQQQQDQQNQNQQTQQDNLKQKEQKISQEEAERILQALKNNEKDLQKKLRKQKGVPVKTEKDW